MPSNALLKAAIHKEVVLVASVTLAIEYQAVCYRAEHILAAGFKAEETEKFVRDAISLIEPIATYFRWRPQLNDPNQEIMR